MDASRKDRLRSQRGRYSYNHLYSQRENVEPLTEQQKARTPDVTHPFARLHPETGREGIYIGGDDFIGVEGADNADREYRSMWQLFEETTERIQYCHRWRVRDLLIWDNRGLAHTATDYDMERERRFLWRTSVIGEVPIAADVDPG